MGSERKSPFAATSMLCCRCHKPILNVQRCEPFAFPADGRFIHSLCVETLLREVLLLMAQLPERVKR